MEKNTDLTYKNPNLFTHARYDFTVQESRILASMLYLTDKFITAGPYSDKFGTIINAPNEQKIVKIPITTILGNEISDNNTHNYENARKAFESLQKKTISLYVNEKQWKSYSLFIYVEKKANEDCITATIAPQVWEILMQMSKPYTLIRLNNILVMRSKYTMRMHQLIENMYKPITYRIDNMKLMFDIKKDEYEDKKDFFRYVLDVAKKELKKLGLTSFEYKKEAKGEKKGKGRPAITHITIIPSYVEYLSITDIRKKIKSGGLLSVFTEEELTAMIQAGFKNEEISANAAIFYNYARNFDLINDIKKMTEKADDKNNPKGWIIAEIKRNVGLLDL